jgi:Tfp pilus assembly protein PilF
VRIKCIRFVHYNLYSNRENIVFLILIQLLVVATFWPAMQCEFVDWDDPIYVTQNQHVRGGLTPAGVAYAFTTFDSHNWIPLTWLSYELDATLFGLNPASFHAVNIAWHSLNAGLLYIVLYRLTGSRYRSAAVAALFAVHPLHVESVAWVSERKDVLSTFFLLLTLLAYQRYSLQPNRSRYLVVTLLMTLGLLAKSMVVTLPLLLLLIDVWPLQRVRFRANPESVTTDDYGRTPWQLIFEKIPLFLLALADGLITIAAQKSAMTASTILPWSSRLGNAVCSYAWYLKATFWPVGLCAYYSHPREALSPATIGVSAILLLVLTALVFLRGRQARHLHFGWWWFVISLLPVIGLLQVGSQAHADRYAYVPHIGLLTLLVWESHRLLVRWKWGRPIATVAAVVAIGGCSVLTWQQTQTWLSSETVWNQALKVDRYNAIAHTQLGQAAMRNRDWDAAANHFTDVMIRRPSDPDAILSLGYIRQQQQKWDLAADYYLWMLRLSPRNPMALQNLASLPPGVIPTPQRSVADEKNRQGLEQARRGHLQAALQLFQEAAEMDPQEVRSKTNAATALEELNRVEEARAFYERALRAKPLDAEALHGLDRIQKRRTDLN